MREMIGFGAQRLIEVKGGGGPIGDAHGESAKRLV